MLGEYAALAKWLAIIAAVSALIYTPYNIGRTLEYNEWDSKEKDKKIIAAQKLKDLNDKAMQDQEKLTLLAQQLETQANDHQTEVNQLNSDLVNAQSHSMQRSGLCSHRSAAQHGQSPSSGTVIDKAADTTQISGEFEKFLISDAMRADSVGLYADEAFLWIAELCKDKQRFLCTGQN